MKPWINFSPESQSKMSAIFSKLSEWAVKIFFIPVLKMIGSSIYDWAAFQVTKAVRWWRQREADKLVEKNQGKPRDEKTRKDELDDINA